MIQDIRPHRLDNHYTEKKPEGEALYFYAKEGKLLVLQKDGVISIPDFCPQGAVPCAFLFSLDGKDCFLCQKGELIPFAGDETQEKEAALTVESDLPDNVRFLSAGEFRGKHPRHLAFAAVTALHLSAWYRNNRFCGSCGERMVHDHIERMMKCPACGRMSFPSIAPAVIVAVKDGDRLLMTKYAGRTYARYALVAGFTEIGETAEETVAREVMEETGLRVKNIRYYKSQPWGISQTLLLGFSCELDGPGDIRMDESELSLARWVTRGEIDKIQDGYDDVSLTNEMICAFRDNIL